jgi:hypothetical protein
MSLRFVVVHTIGVVPADRAAVANLEIFILVIDGGDPTLVNTAVAVADAPDAPVTVTDLSTVIEKLVNDHKHIVINTNINIKRFIFILLLLFVK